MRYISLPAKLHNSLWLFVCGTVCRKNKFTTYKGDDVWCWKHFLVVVVCFKDKFHPKKKLCYSYQIQTWISFSSKTYILPNQDFSSLVGALTAIFFLPFWARFKLTYLWDVDFDSPSNHFTRCSRYKKQFVKQVLKDWCYLIRLYSGSFLHILLLLHSGSTFFFHRTYVLKLTT